MTKLTFSEIESSLAKMQGWTYIDGALVKFYVLENFLDALTFVNLVGHAAEAAQHHPDIDIRYNRVKLSLITHDAGGVTSLDVKLASQADELAVS